MRLYCAVCGLRIVWRLLDHIELIHPLVYKLLKQPKYRSKEDRQRCQL